MGLTAKQAVPALRKMLAEPKVEDKATIRIVLANLGDESKENLDAILADLKAGNLTSMLFALPFIRPRAWVTDAMIAELARPMKRLPKTKQGLEAVLASADLYSLVLGVLGKRAASEVGTLEEMQRVSLELEAFSAFSSTLALARVDPKRQQAALKRFLTANRVGPGGHGGIFWMPEYSYLLLDAQLSQALGGFVEDPDPRVAERAVLFLYSGGLAARDAVPRVMKALRGKADEERRVVLAQLLVAIAEYTHLPELEAMLKEEKSAKVREALAKAIRFIKDLPDEDS